MSAYGVTSPTAVAVRINGVLEQRYYGEVVELDGRSAQRFVVAGSLTPIESPAEGATT